MAEKKVIQKLGIDAQVIINKMSPLQIGESIAYEDLSQAIGSMVDGSSGSLSTARNRMLRDLGMVFGTIRGEGLRRLSDSEKIKVAYSKVESVKRTTHRGLTIAQTIDPTTLGKEESSRLNLTISHLGILAHASTAKAGKRIEGRIMSNNGLVPPAVGLELLK
jgi:hypothetical protein